MISFTTLEQGKRLKASGFPLAEEGERCWVITKEFQDSMLAKGNQFVCMKSNAGYWPCDEMVFDKEEILEEYPFVMAARITEELKIDIDAITWYPENGWNIVVHPDFKLDAIANIDLIEALVETYCKIKIRTS